MSGVDDPLARAAKNDDGTTKFVRVQGRTGQWYLMPADPDGGPLTFWSPPNEEIDEEAFRDEHGNVLAGVVCFRNGSTHQMPLDASLRPVLSMVAIVNPDGLVESANPGGWPLTEDELDATEPPPDSTDLPDWQRDVVTNVARDGLWRYLTTRMRAADGGWADVLMSKGDQPLSVEADWGVMAGGPPNGQVGRFTFMLLLGGLVAVELDAEGRPVRSNAAVRHQLEK